MEDWKEILDSPLLQHNGYISWEEYIRMSVSSEGIIYPMYAYDEKYTLEPLFVGFVFIPSPPMLITTEFGEVMDEVLYLFSCYDYPKYSEQFVAELITMELNKNPPTLEPGNGPNWAKKLLEVVKGQENNPAQPVVNSLFSFQNHP